jgi:hypothetical protein
MLRSDAKVIVVGSLDELFALLGQADAHKELTADEYINKVARIIAVYRLLTEQMQNPSLRSTQMGTIFGMSAMIMSYGPDRALVSEFEDLAHMLESHSTEARALAPVNENVAKALADFTMFRDERRQRQVAQREAAEQRMEALRAMMYDGSDDEANAKPDSPASPRMN